MFNYSMSLISDSKSQFTNYEVFGTRSMYKGHNSIRSGAGGRLANHISTGSTDGYYDIGSFNYVSSKRGTLLN